MAEQLEKKKPALKEAPPDPEMLRNLDFLTDYDVVSDSKVYDIVKTLPEAQFEILDSGKTEKKSKTKESGVIEDE